MFSITVDSYLLYHHQHHSLCQPLLYVRVSGDIVNWTLYLAVKYVLQYVRLISNPTPSYKVKIKEGDLDSALAKVRREGCFVARWCDKSCIL